MSVTSFPPADRRPPAARTIVCASSVMAELVQLATQAGASDAKVLITGESGTGKDLLAQHVHTSSPRARGPFVAVNCAGLTESLLESELFGHVKGSFTGAYRDKQGQLQMAHGGTLFLDEVGEMSLRMQALLLRFLENGEVQPVGADRVRTNVDVRVVAATNRNLDERVAAGEFREDLLFRLRVIHLHVPPLRDRGDDIAPLVVHFTRKAGRTSHFTEAAISVLRSYRWPGNIRELHNVVERTLALCDRPVIDVGDLPPGVRSNAIRFVPKRERRRQVADDLYQALTEGGCRFWEHVHPMFLSRDITRHDIRELVKKGLAQTRGNYRAVLRLFGMPAEDYKKFLNFLAAHECSVDFRPFRTEGWDQAATPQIRRLKLPDPGPDAAESA